MTRIIPWLMIFFFAQLAQNEEIVLDPLNQDNTINRYLGGGWRIDNLPGFSPGDGITFMWDISYERNFIEFEISNSSEVDSALITFSLVWTMGDGLSLHYPKFFGEGTHGALSYVNWGDELELADWDTPVLENFTLVDEIVLNTHRIDVTPVIRNQGGESVQFMISCWPHECDNDGLFDNFSVRDFKLVLYTSPTSVPAEDSGNQALVYRLDQNFPNPFNPSTTISYVIPADVHVVIDVYNILGQPIIQLVNAFQPAGCHQAEWHGISSEGGAVSSGVYFYRIKAGQFSASRIMVLTR